MSQLTLAYPLARFGPHLKPDQLASLLETKDNMIYKMVAMGIKTPTGSVTNSDVADAIQADIILVPRTVASRPIFKTSCKHFEALPAGQPRGTQEGVPAARGQQ